MTPIELEQGDLFATRVRSTEGKPSWATEDVIAWCNEVRAGEGKEGLLDLPSGLPGNFAVCPIARAMDGFPDDIPKQVAEWIHDFDSGRYPEYVDEWLLDLWKNHPELEAEYVNETFGVEEPHLQPEGE